jgi:hypothetical protein
MNNTWDIMPYERVGKLRFDDPQDDAINLLGQEDLRERNHAEDEEILYWHDNGIQVVFENHGKNLSMISFYSNISNIFIENTPLKWNDTTSFLKLLIENDPSLMKVSNIIVSFKYGVSAGGFTSSDISTKSITAFKKGRWSPNDPLLRPIDMKDMENDSKF